MSVDRPILRYALIANPTPARFDECMAAFKPFYINLVGQGWQDGIGAALAEEVARCNQIMTAAPAARHGGQHAPPAG